MQHRTRLMMIVLFLFLITAQLACNPNTRKTPVQSPTGTPNEHYLCKNDSAGVWDCSSADRKVIFRKVPDNLKVFNYPYQDRQKELLTDQMQTAFKVVAIAGDYRFYEGNTAVTNLQAKVTVQVEINQSDLEMLKRLNRTDKDVTLIQAVQTETGFAAWKAVKVTVLERSSSTVILQLSDWGADPPSGWGVGN